MTGSWILEYLGSFSMKSTLDITGMDPALKAEMQQACERIAQGLLPTMAQRQAAASRTDHMREENARLYGVQDATLDAVRESRSAR
jgi:hypothetical protein